MSEFTIAFIVRSDLKMTKGKIAAQCAHALLDLAAKSRSALKHGRIISLRCHSEHQLYELQKEAQRLSIPNAIQTDMGLTQVKENTDTVLALGPAVRSQLDKVIKDLKLL